MEEIQTKITSYLDFLLKNEKDLPLSLSNGKNIIGYIKDKTDYYNRYYEERYKFDENKNYQKSDLYQINSEIIRVKKYIEEVILNNLTDNYHVSNFLQNIVRLKKLEEQKQKFEKVKRQTERVENLFGPIKTKNRIDSKKGFKYEYRSSFELTEDRNARFAVLNELYATGKMEESEFINNVVAVRKCYEREIQNASVMEAYRILEEQKELVKPTVKLKNKIKDCISRVKKAFKIGKVEVLNEEIKDNFAKKSVVNLGAFEALNSVRELLNKSQDGKAIDESNACFEESVAVLGECPVFILSNEAEKEFAKMLEGKTAIHKANARELVRSVNGKVKVRQKSEITSDEVDFLNYLTKKYKYVKNLTINEKGQMTQTIQFEDEKVQKIYEEVMSMFSTMRKNIENCATTQERIEDKASKIEKNITA